MTKMPKILKEIFSDDKTAKAVIELREHGLIEVQILKWTEEIVPDYGKVDEFWLPVEGSALTDTLERAEEIAQEKVKAWATPKDKSRSN